MFWFVNNLYTFFMYLFSPLILVLILLLLAIFIKRKVVTRFIIAIAFCILYFSSTGFVSGYLLSGLEKYKSVEEDVILSHKALILLGGGLVKHDESVQPTLLAYSRILEAYRLYHVAKEKGVHYKIIVTGGDVRKYGLSEAEVYGKILEDMGVSKADLILETQSLNTYQNAEYTKRIIKDLPYEEYLLVTSSIHMSRSLLYFNHFQINVIPAISDHPSPIAHWLPLTYNLALFNFALHEYQGILRLYAYDYFKLNTQDDEKK